MTEKQSDRIDSASEGMALLAHGNVKNLLVTALDLAGSIDEQAMRQALIETIAEFPHLATVFHEVKHRGRFHLERRVVTPDRFPFTSAQAAEPPAGGGEGGRSPQLAAFLTLMRDRLDRERDFFYETPGEFFLLKFGTHDYFAGVALHHCAADPTIASEFGRRVFFAYHRLVTGEKAELPPVTNSLSTSSKRTMKVDRASVREQILFAFRQAISPLFTAAAFPLGKGDPHDTREFHPKRVLDEADTERALKGSMRKRSAIVDVLAACANVAVDRWNEQRGVPTGLLTTAMTVNMKGRRRSEGLNNSSTLFFKFPPEARSDVIMLARSFTRERVGQFKRRHDFHLFETLDKTARLLNVLPFRPRRRVFQAIVNRAKLTVAVTFLGVVWPKDVQGRSTGESYPLALGDLTIRGMHGIGYKLLSGTPIVLIAYIFNKRLHLIPATAASLFTKEEAESFLDLVTSVLLETFQ